MDDRVFSGRVALVTGGSGGIGAALCRELASAGASIAIGYGRNAASAQRLADELSAAGAAAAAYGADLEDPDAPAQMVDAVERSLGPVDLLVANHGLARQAPYEEVDAELFDRTLAVNLRAPFLLAQAVLPGMRSRRFGRILLISSTAAFRGGVVGPHYAASKAGLHGLTYFLASRAAADGVTVNALAPGFIDTPMLPDDPSRLVPAIPVGRLGRPDEVADLAVSILRNGYVTAHVFSADGGMHPG
jgi:3-oxoacyl-[acyl-carrier protein] reductase